MKEPIPKVKSLMSLTLVFQMQACMTELIMKDIRCTCGNQGQYCGDSFDAQGGMLYEGTYIMNVGDFGFLGDLSSY